MTCTDPTAGDPFQRFIDHLNGLDLVPGAVGEGDAAPDFLLSSPDGALIGLAELLADGPAVVSFIRGEWCPVCQQEMRDLAEAQGAIRAAGARLVAITPESGTPAARMRREHRLPFPVLCDIDLGVALAYGLVFRLTDEMRRVHREAGYDLPVQQQHDGWLLPIPATYVIDPAGLVRAAHVDANYRERMSAAAILSALDALGGGGAGRGVAG